MPVKPDPNKLDRFKKIDKVDVILTEAKIARAAPENTPLDHRPSRGAQEGRAEEGRGPGEEGRAEEGRTQERGAEEGTAAGRGTAETAGRRRHHSFRRVPGGRVAGEVGSGDPDRPDPPGAAERPDRPHLPRRPERDRGAAHGRLQGPRSRGQPRQRSRVADADFRPGTSGQDATQDCQCAYEHRQPLQGVRAEAACRRQVPTGDDAVRRDQHRGRQARRADAGRDLRPALEDLLRDGQPRPRRRDEPAVAA